MSRLGEVLPADEGRLRRWVESAPTVEVRCPACGTHWERLGKELPKGFDGICPGCWDRGVRSVEEVPHDRPRFLRDSGYPLILRESFLDRPGVPGEPAREVLAWQGFPWSIGLVGPTGTGKSMVAAEIGWRLRDRYRTQRFIRSDRLVTVLYGRLGEEERARVYADVTECSLLVLDDLGWGNRGGAMDLVFEVLAERHGEGKPTIWTGNLDPVDLVEVNAPMLRRLMEGLLVRFEEVHEWGRT